MDSQQACLTGCPGHQVRKQQALSKMPDRSKPKALRLHALGDPLMYLFCAHVSRESSCLHAGPLYVSPTVRYRDNYRNSSPTACVGVYLRARRGS